MKHLLSCADLSREEAVALLDTAARMAETGDRTIRKLPVLNGRQVAIMFFEDSTRTRLSFDAAAKRLSADVLNFVGKGSSLSKGESLKDTAQTLEAMGADAFIIRHSASGAPLRLATSGWTDAPIINAGDGTHQHPTQALLDAYTLRDRLAGGTGALDGLNVVIVGDILHSRVARSNVDLLTLLGADVTLVAPPTLIPIGAKSWPVRWTSEFDDAIAGRPDAVMMLRVQRERMSGGGGFFPSAEEYHRRYGLHAERFAALGPDTIILHPGPMNRGLEITAEVADHDRSVVVDQVHNGVHVRMAVLYQLLGGAQ